jgi:hypothetical protein
MLSAESNEFTNGTKKLGAINTFTGKRFNILDPQPDQIDIRDIAAHLSKLCRFTGSIRFHYSVAQHSYYASMFCQPGYELACLLHDAAEAYMNDLSRPIKHVPEMIWYREQEHKVWSVLADVFGLPDPLPPHVKEIDNRLVCTEGWQLQPHPNPDHWSFAEHLPLAIEEWTPRIAEQMFLQRYYHLTATHS